MGWDPWEEAKDWAEEGGFAGDELKDLWDGLTGETAADASREAAGLQQDAAIYAADLSQQQYETTRADQMPWLEAGEQALGTLQDKLAGGAPSFQDYEQSDYSKFIQEQGLESIEAKGRAGGYYNTGASSKEMQQYGQDIAGQDYQNYINNYYQSLNPYLSLSGAGQMQAQTLAQQGAQNAGQQGAYAQQAAGAEAAGIVGAANAQTQGLQNMIGLGLTAGGLAAGGLPGMLAGGAGSSFQTPQGWGSQNTGQGFQSAWAQ